MHQDTVYWVEKQLAQRKGLKFHQTRSNEVILYDTLPAHCISKAIVMKSEEIIYWKVFVSPRPPPTISFKDNWTCDLNSDVSRSSKDIQRIELKPNTPVIKYRKTCHQMEKKPCENAPSLIAILIIKRNMVMSQIQRVRRNPYANTNPQNVAC